jgi:AraC-like DNA-binding protein
VRAELACNFLRETDLSIAEIGERVGIQDIAKFRRAFRRWAGVTPREWRAK